LTQDGIVTGDEADASQRYREEDHKKGEDFCKTETAMKGATKLIKIGFILIGMVIVIPCIFWLFRIVTGKISMTSLDIQTDDVITYAIGLLTLLVTIVTLSVGLMALWGYQNIKDAARLSAEREVKNAIKTMNEQQQKFWLCFPSVLLSA
jgi:H+/Cl- antiporter ClcA